MAVPSLESMPSPSPLLDTLVGLLSGSICTYHRAAPGSSPNHTINSFIIYSQFVLDFSCEKYENKQKEAGFGPFFKTSTTPLCGQKRFISQLVPGRHRHAAR